jgi:hypothetical protein
MASFLSGSAHAADGATKYTARFAVEALGFSRASGLRQPGRCCAPFIFGSSTRGLDYAALRAGSAKSCPDTVLLRR